MRISEFIINVVELLEAQCEEIRLSFLKSVRSVILGFVAALIFVVGIIFLLIGFEILLEKYIGEAGSYFVVAGIAFLIFMIVLWLSNAKTK